MFKAYFYNLESLIQCPYDFQCGIIVLSMEDHRLKVHVDQRVVDASVVQDRFDVKDILSDMMCTMRTKRKVQES